MAAERTLAQLVRYERERRNWTQKDLEKASGVSRSNISAIELGGIKIPQPHVIAALADALEVPDDDFLRAIGFRLKADHETYSQMKEQKLLNDITDLLRRHGRNTANGESGA